MTGSGSPHLMIPEASAHGLGGATFGLDEPTLRVVARHVPPVRHEIPRARPAATLAVPTFATTDVPQSPARVQFVKRGRRYEVKLGR